MNSKNENQKKSPPKKLFKPVPKKFHPNGLEVIYEDHDIVAVNKSAGLLSMGNDKEREKTAYFLMNAYVKKGNQKSKNRIFIVHRLDKETSGVLLFAKHERGKRFLQEEWATFNKQYHAIVNGNFNEKEGRITSHLAENSIHKMYSVSDPEKGKFAETEFKVIEESSKYSYLSIGLLTGRKNQIRVHLAEKGHPILGDLVYGKKEKGVQRLMLHASSLTITHPYTKEKITFQAKLPAEFHYLIS